MRIFDRLLKKVFTFRKIMWLFLCGMLVISKAAVAQPTDQGEKGPPDSSRASNTPPVVKYGPPPSVWEKISNDPKSNEDQASKAQEEMERQLEINRKMTVKYGPQSPVKPRLTDAQPTSTQPAKSGHAKKHRKVKKTHTKATAGNEGAGVGK